MRNLDECKSEIFRLGDEKIKKRKKRRIRVISVCVPLCLCLVVWSVVILPAMLPASMMDGNENETPMTESSNELAGIEPMKYAQVEIKGIGGTEFYNVVKEPLKTNYIANLIEGFYVNDSDGSTGSTDDKPNYQSKPPEQSLPENFTGGYLISFSTDKGFVVEYTLSANELKDESTGEIIILTEAQREKLFNEIAGGI